ncbi:MAG: hypothetical protein HY898_18830 [Deltaproteobacteria bacterium]|nr:hypothetical protein [Deltaproteobacteria bacterium]
MKLIAVAGVIVAGLTAPATLLAGPSSSDPKAAEALFLDGRNALLRKDYAVACSKFQESLSLVRRPSTLLNLAQCEEAQGKLVAALGHWKEGASALEQNDDRLPIAMEHIESLAQKIPVLKLVLEPGFPASARVILDGVELASALVGTELRLDPGTHDIVIRVQDAAEQKQNVRLEQGVRKELVLRWQGQSAGAGQPTTSSDASAGRSSSRRTVAYLSGGVGIVGVVGAVVTGAMVLSKDAAIKDDCPDKQCNAQGRDAIRSVDTLMTVNAVSWGVGAVGLGVAAWLLLTGDSATPRSTAWTPWAGPGGYGLGMQRSF